MTHTYSPGVEVNHISQRDAVTRRGYPQLAVKGQVVKVGYAANTGAAYVEVFWYGPEGGYGNYRPAELAVAA